MYIVGFRRRERESQAAEDKDASQEEPRENEGGDRAQLPSPGNADVASNPPTLGRRLDHPAGMCSDGAGRVGKNPEPTYLSSCIEKLSALPHAQ